MTLYLETNPKERAAEAKQLAKVAVSNYYKQRELPSVKQSVDFDIEQIEQERPVNGAA